MDKETKKRIIFLVRDIIVALIFVLVMIPLVLMFATWADTLENRIIYSDTDVSIGLIKEYSNFSLTLFGFTLIGGIFAGKRKKKKPENKDEVEITKSNLLVTSIIFLLSFIIFSILYLLVYPTGEMKYTYMLSFLLITGIGLFMAGIVFLIMNLTNFFISRYTTLKERYHSFWKKMGGARE